MNLAKALSGGSIHHANKSWLSKRSVKGGKEECHVSGHHFLNCHAGRHIGCEKFY